MCRFIVKKRNDQENSTRKAWEFSLATKEIEGLERETTKVSCKKVSANPEFATIKVLSKLDICINIFSPDFIYKTNQTEEGN